MERQKIPSLIHRIGILIGVCFTVCFSASATGNPIVTSDSIPAESSSISCELLSYSQAEETDVANSSKPFYMAVKSNLLYDLATVPNIGVEFYAGYNISVAAEWMYAWWSHDRRHRYWRIYGGDVTARYWFGKAAEEKPLTGHHAGIYAGAFTFDFEWGGAAYMGGRPGHSLWDRCMINAGVEYGYSLPLTRHLNIDFNIGIGYIGGIVEKFIPEGDDYVWESTARRKWFGPAKAEVTLVWLIGHGNVNAGKGGRRK